jgi:hypothetical protein
VTIELEGKEGEERRRERKKRERGNRMAFRRLMAGEAKGNVINHKTKWKEYL